jgi:hypothetical protein
MTEGGRWGLLIASESATKVVGIRKLRREISSDWRRLGQEDERDMEEGSESFL